MSELTEYYNGKRLYERLEGKAWTKTARRFWADRIAYCNRKIGEILALKILCASIVLIIVISGCCTVKGVMNDSAWILRTTADNIQVQEK